MTRFVRRSDVGAAVAGWRQATIKMMDHATGISRVSDSRCLFMRIKPSEYHQRQAV